MTGMVLSFAWGPSRNLSFHFSANVFAMLGISQLIKYNAVNNTCAACTAYGRTWRRSLEVCLSQLSFRIRSLYPILLSTD